MPPFKAGEKITDPAILERLAKAREKALEVRQANKKTKDDEKLLKQMEKKQKAQEVTDKLDAIANPAPSESKESAKKKSPEPTDVESEPEEEIIVVKKKKKKPKKKVIYVNESQSESEDEYSKPSKGYVPPAAEATVHNAAQPVVPEAPAPMSYADKMFEATYGRLKRF